MSYAPPSAMPGYVPAGDPTAVSGRRIVAWIIDAIIYVVLSVVLQVTIGGGFKTHDLSNWSGTANSYCDAWKAVNSGTCFAAGNSAWTNTSQGSSFAIFLGLFVAYVVIQGLLGGSLGKVMLGLRIVKADGSKAGILSSFLRTLLWIVDAVTCGVPLVGLVCMVTTKGHRRVGDMAAGTYVVRKAQLGMPLAVGGATLPPGAYPGGGYPGGYGSPAMPPGGYTPYGAPGAVTPPPGPGGPTAAPYAPGPQSQTYEADAPTWDAKRNTYIQYDSARSAWLEFDQATQEWKPISQ